MAKNGRRPHTRTRAASTASAASGSTRATRFKPSGERTPRPYSASHHARTSAAWDATPQWGVDKRGSEGGKAAAAPRAKVPAPKRKRRRPALLAVTGQWEALFDFRQLPEGRPKPGYKGPTRADLMEKQPARSPDCNILDLCIFRSWAARNHKLQKFCRANDLDALWANIQETWAGYPVEVVKRSWINKSLILRGIKKAKGGNFFNVPHVSEEPRSQIIHWH